MYYLKLKGQPIETNYNKNNEERAERTQVNQPLTPVYFFWCFRWMSCCNSEIPTASPSAIAAKLSLLFQGDMTLEFLLTCPAWFHLFHFSNDLQTCKFSSSKEEMAFPRRHSDKESACRCRRRKKRELDPWAGKSPWRRKRQPTPASLPGKSHGQRSLVGCGPWGRKESDTSEWQRAHRQVQTPFLAHMPLWPQVRFSSSVWGSCSSGLTVFVASEPFTPILLKATLQSSCALQKHDWK